MLRLFVIDFCSVGKELNLFLPLLGLAFYCKNTSRNYFSIAKLFLGVFCKKTPGGLLPGVIVSFRSRHFFLSGEVIISLHNRRFISQARRTWYFAQSVGRLRSFIPHLRISHNAAYLPPKILHKHFFLISLGTAVIPRSKRLLEMKNKGYTQFWGQIRCFMGDVQVAYIFYSPHLVLRARFALRVKAAFTSWLSWCLLCRLSNS